MLLTTLLAVGLPCAHATLTYKGVDWSSLLVEEAAGKSYSDTDGTSGSLETILVNNGVNIVRQRLWYDPSDGNYNLDYNLKLAKRAYDAGMEIYLDIHFSDTWADPSDQAVPAAWADYSVSELITAVQDYTESTMNSFASAGIPLAIVAIGNEITDGMLFPTGDMDDTDGSYNLAEYLHAASAGIKASNLDTIPKIMIHLSDGWDWDTQEWWYETVLAEGPFSTDDFDLHGVSYYPFYNADATLAALKTSLTNLYSKYGKDVMVVETNWPSSCPDPEYDFPSDTTSIPFSPAGQTEWMQDVAGEVEDAGGSGLFYWEPAWLDNESLGSSCVYNLLFETSGEAMSRPDKPDMTAFTTREKPLQIGTSDQAVATAKLHINGTSTNSSVLHANFNSERATIVNAEGNYLTTSDGVKIFDATGGAAVACIGHNHPRVKQAIVDQLASVAYCYSPFFTNPASERLAKHLTDSTDTLMSKVFIVSSGTEAVEAGLKLARHYFTVLEGPQTKRHRFIAREQSYHGNTLGSLSVGGHKARKATYLPLLGDNVSHVSAPYPYRRQEEGESDDMYVRRLADELETEFQQVGPDTVCAFVAETMSGLTLGAVPPPPGYLRAMKAVCDRHGALFLLDEVMSGMGRTGSLHAWQQEGVVPHLQSVAKGLGAGYEPIGALLVNASVVDVLSNGTGSFNHSQTYQGHPVACAAASEVQQIVQDEQLLKNVLELGPYLGELLQKRLGQHKHVGNIRGRGFMWAIEFVLDKASKTPFPVEDTVAARLHATGLQHDFSISLLPGAGVVDGVNGDVIMLAPAYNVTRADTELIVERTLQVVKHVLGDHFETR
ncbi:putative aminobutyrate aminotransferase [Teratosphaeria destructans]|uniref:Arabinogalactan endo-beta-1,4-galactanase n=1 Tax=Teratosphaeria destructans TaxID=418781 RepID=A0A9W7SJ00_9PEZI|nr:putative aminobutyrate aminotransferase [Teratosphaeria destructans]